MVIAGIYCRISRDGDGDGLGVARQEQDCRVLAERHGLVVADVYTDNDIGASDRSRKKRRPEYERMLEDARTGRIGVVLAYSNSRLTRRLRELEDLITLHERHGVRVLTVVSGEDDLSTADGRMVARIKASVDAAEAERTAERVKRKHLENAQNGKAVGGRRPFGWQPDKVTLNEYEAQLLRQAAADVLAGVRLATIVQQWNDAGVRTVTGKEWSGNVLLQVLRSPRLAGWRIHRTGDSKWTKVPPVALDRQGQPVRGEWEPIIDHATHLALVEKLTSKPDRRTVVPRKNAHRYQMSGLLRCALCDGPMFANRVSDDAHYYRCDTAGCSNSASGKGVDAWVGERVVERSELVAAQEAPNMAGPDARLAELNTQIDDIKAMIEDVMAALRTRAITAATALPNVAKLEESLEPVLAERDALLAETALSAPEALDADAWAAMDVDRRRAAAERVLQAVYVHKATKRGNRFDASRLDPVWK
jgi:site-specific DNA recombinase